MFFWRENPVTPTEGEYERGRRFCFYLDCKTDSDGTIVDGRSNELCWRYETIPRRSPWSPFNLVEKTAFVVFDPEDREVIQIRRDSHFPPAFALVENKEIVGKIRIHSLFRNKYAIEIDNGTRWIFRMPLFTVHFWGKSNLNSRVWVRVGPSKTQWNVLTEPEGGYQRLLFSLSFIHHEWWYYS